MADHPAYACTGTIERIFRGEGRQSACAATTPAAVRRWQARARVRLADLLGLRHFRACPPRPRRLSVVALADMRREEWVMTTAPGVDMPFTVLVPDPLPAGPLPGVICPHGHVSGGKWSTGGRDDIAEVRASIRDFHYDYGVQLARAGFIAICPDARGFGERCEPGGSPVHGSCYQLAFAGLPLGFTVRGMWAWDLMRLVDVVAADARIDPRRIACAGLSGGGLQTLDLAALDQRIAAAVVSGYFYGSREALLRMTTNCICNVVPGMWRDFDMGDIGALIAPRPLHVETGDQDPLNGASGVGNVRPQVAIARGVYRTFGAGGAIAHHVFSGGHRWDGTRSIPWLQRRLAPNPASSPPGESHHGIRNLRRRRRQR
jgi:dienelactone hydrolase